jgi:hypothetical protein
VEYSGIPVIYHQREGRYWQPQWRPWPGEKVDINISRPKGIQGNTKTIDHSTLRLTPGELLTQTELEFNLRSSLGGQHDLRIPEGSDLMSVSINDRNLPIRLNGNRLTLPITPGSQRVNIVWREARGIQTGLFATHVLDFGMESANTNITILPGVQRWVLFAGGPALGPAVLFWGVFIVILIIAVGLSRIPDMPLNTWHWLLLGIGLSASSPAAGLLIVVWLLALRSKAKMPAIQHSVLFNGVQILLIILTFLSLLTLFVVIEQGLLGTPDMQITGNQSSASMLNWYNDRSDAILPTAWIITVPLIIYRVLMLIWAIWLAFALLKWLRWGWECYSTHGYWREIAAKLPKRPSQKKPKQSLPEQSQSEQSPSDQS